MNSPVGGLAVVDELDREVQIGTLHQRNHFLQRIATLVRYS